MSQRSMESHPVEEATDPAQLEKFNPLSPAVQANPYPFYHRYRSNAPIHWGAPVFSNQPGSWYFFRYMDIAQILRDNKHFGSDAKRSQIAAPTSEPVKAVTSGAALAFRDEPDHKRLRSLMSKAFTPQVVTALIPHIQEISEGLIDQIQAKGSKRFDLIQDFAFPLPITVITELLGIPTQDREEFRAWSHTIMAGIERSPSSEEGLQAKETIQSLHQYLRAIFNEKRQHPGSDLVSKLVAIEEQGSKLTEEELLTNCTFLLIAGHETTVHLISSGMLALLNHPDQFQKLREDPTLSENALEEMLRYYSPVQSISRWVLKDVKIEGKTLRKGQHVSLMLGAGNRDPEFFEEPDRFDILRQEAPNIAFSIGIHFCMGSPLARTEGDIAIRTLLRRFPNLQLEPEAVLEWQDSQTVRGLKDLPVTY
ncbi:MAG: cytochrome P450 [Chloroflexota bacterium]|nr:cytochrome P450 [Chloroflexota bacterium]